MVSIIIPVYNTAALLDRCLRSIISQSFSDWECILVDDGSTDGSADICDRYVLLDKRFKVFHKKNEGVAMARKLGVLHASGEYSIHVDPDDYVERTMLEEMYSCAQSSNADVVVSDYIYESAGKKSQVIVQKPSGDDVNSMVVDVLLNKLHGSLCNKLLRHSCYKTYCLEFYKEINYCEDVLLWAQLYGAPLKVAYLPKAYYHYCTRDDSITSPKIYTFDTYLALKAFCKMIEGIDKLDDDIKKYVCHRTKLGAIENNVLPRDEYYSFSPPSLKVIMMSRKIRLVIFGLLAQMGLFRTGSVFLRASNCIIRVCKR